MIQNLVLSGGANKCIVFVGAVQALEELNILSTIRHYAGTSGGAILALLLVLGYSVSDIVNLYKELNLYDLLNINTTHILHFFDNFGFDNGDTIIHILKFVIQKKTHNGIITFKKLYEQTQKTLVITGTCVEKECVEYFDHIQTPDMPVYLAVRISIGLPFIFNRIIYKELSYVDGGLLEYFPIHYFKNMSQTLALGIRNNSLDNIKQIESIDKFIYKILCGLYRIHQDNLMDTCTGPCIVYDISDNTLDNMTKDTKLRIIEIGYSVTKDYFCTRVIQDTIEHIITTIVSNS